MKRCEADRTLDRSRTGIADDDIRAPKIEIRPEFGVGDVVPVFLQTRGWKGELTVSLKASDFVNTENCLRDNVLKVQPHPAKTLCWKISVDRPMSFEIVVQAAHEHCTWILKKKVTAYKLHRLGIDPTIAFCMIRYHDDEEAYWENRSGVCGYTVEYPLKLALQDFKASNINALIMTGSCGSMLKEDYIQTEWFRKYVSGAHSQGMRVGICLPFADTHDNYVTSGDPDVQQRTHTGDLRCIGDGVAVVEMDAPAFVDYAKTLIEKSSLVGVDIIDYAEPDYWPERTTGHNPYIKRRWKKNFKKPFPRETNPAHRLFLEDCRVEALINYSLFIHSLGLADHLTAAPLGHRPALICQNYGKYSLTPITELSSTYHDSFSAGINNMLEEKGIFPSSPYKPDSVGCIEVRFMGDWNKRHGVYIGCGQMTAEKYRNRIDVCAFLHNMDIFLWEYPLVTGQAIPYGQKACEEIPIAKQKLWEEIRATFGERFGTYLGLDPEYHAAGPYPHVFMTVSKRTVYFKQEDWVLDSMYRNGLRLIDAHLPFGIVWPEFPDPLLEEDTPIRVLMLGEDVPVSDGFLRAVEKWYGKGKALIYFGGPSHDWDSGKRLKALPVILRKMLKAEAASVKKTSLKDFLSDYGVILPEKESNPTVIVVGDKDLGFAVRVDSLASKMSDNAYALLVATTSKLVDAMPLELKTSGDIEACIHRNGKNVFISLFNHGNEESDFRVSYALGGPAVDVREIVLSGQIEFQHTEGQIIFDGSLAGRQVAIYRISQED